MKLSYVGADLAKNVLQLQGRGYEVRLIAPQFVKPFVKSNKNDRNDAEAICEAMTRPHMRFVPVKTVEQQDIQAIHQVHRTVMSQRNAKANQIRGLVATVGDGSHFRKGRPMAAAIGLTPGSTVPATNDGCWASASAAMPT